MPIVVCVLAHNEERRIARCLSSMPQASDGIAVHVVVNGSTDRTAQIARTFPVTVHDWAQGGKARSWNRFVLDTPGIEGEAFVFVDGDAEVVPGSIEALARTLADHPQANAASGLAANGRRAEAYRRELIASRGLFGDLYALSGSFVARLRASGIRLPEDLIGDDSLVGALAKTGLADESDWRDDRIVPCPQAGFLCEPTALTSLASLRGQYARMVNYAVRHFQNRMVSQIMREAGPQGLPRRMAELYPEWLPRLAPRFSPVWFWFDRKALARMRAASPSS
ncbi:MAG TPA: glycosyltransferase family A protein [Novosphingobium sp.]|nr:glycosyltransferase family A protein [Novosphingobium sp.]